LKRELFVRVTAAADRPDIRRLANRQPEGQIMLASIIWVKKTYTSIRLILFVGKVLIYIKTLFFAFTNE
tara:strand:+ start:712 stop:918 length:207 start_codon:yes stop_codon:yes gene_type:complete